MPKKASLQGGPNVCAIESSFIAWRSIACSSRREKAVYTPLPPFPARWLRDSFEVFCVHMQRAHALVLPQRPDFQEALRQAQARLISVRALGLLRAVFRRPIELWLVLDRVCYLQEHGFDVQLGTFCPPSITPRNLLIIAQKA
jgi:hypothetical protein